MANTFRKLGLAAAVALALTACGGDDDAAPAVTDPGTGGSAPILDVAKYMVVATDTDGYITFFGDDGNGRIERIGAEAEAVRATDGESNYLSLGEVNFTHDGKLAVIIVSSGFKDDAGNATGGGFLLVDMATRQIVKAVPLINTRAANTDGGLPVTRPTHSYMDGASIWINNDGPRDDAATTEVNESAQADSLFHVHLDCADINGPMCGHVDKEIVLGNGHKKSAQNATYFASHNLSDQSISIVHKADGAVEKTISLKINPDPADPTKMLSNVPHGMDYSEKSGKFYTGITNGADMGVAVVNASDLSLTSIPSVAQGGLIPAAGYVHAVHEGKWVLTVGYLSSAKRGAISVIDAETDTVTDVVELGDFQASSFDTHEHDGKTMVVVGASNVGGVKDQIKIFHLDNTTGKAQLDTAGAQDIHSVTVGYGPAHRNGAVTAGGERAYYPNSCAPAPAAAPAGATGHTAHFLTEPRHSGGAAGTECNTLVTVNLMDHHSEPMAMHTWGSKDPSGIGIVAVSTGAAAPATDTTTGTDGHTGHTH